MDFEERARKAHDRGQLVRAAVMLAEGLKRHPDRIDALDFLTNLFANELRSPGLEQDLVDALVAQDDRRERIEFVLERYAERDKRTMGRELARAANERFGGFEWPPPAPLPPGDDEEPADIPSVESHPGDRPAEEAEPVEAPEPASGEPAPDRAPASPETSDLTTGAKPDEERREESLRKVQERLAAPATSVSASDQESHQAESAPVDLGGVSAEPVTSEETDTSEQETDSAGRDDRRSLEMPARRSRRVVVLAIAVLAVLGVGFVSWHFWGETEQASDVESDDVDLDVLDTALRDSVPEELGTPPEEASDGDALIHRRMFVEAAFAVDWGEELREPTPGDSRWSLAYRAVFHAQNEDFERAIADVTRLEHRFPGDAVTIWARGVVEEKRGRNDRALKAFSKGAGAFSKFVPFWTGQIRILTRQGRVQEDVSPFRKLESRSSDHPYLYIEQVVWPTHAMLFDGTLTEVAEREFWPSDDERLPRVVEAATLVDRAVTRDDVDGGRASIEAAVELEPDLVPAQLILGVVNAESLDVAAAESAFEAAFDVVGTSPDLNWLLQSTAQQSLAAVGRPDRGLRFAPPFEFDGEDAQNSAAGWIPESVATPVPSGTQLESKLAAESLGVRSVLLAELGMFSTATTQLEAAKGLVASSGFLQLVEVQIRILEGERNAAIRARRQIKEGAYRDLALAAVSFHDGDYEVAIDASERVIAEGRMPHLAARYGALSLAGRGHVRQALAQIESWEAGPVVSVGFRALKMRVLSRVDPDARDVRGAYKALIGTEPKGVRRLLDLAATDFWRKRYSSAARHLEAATLVAPAHPEVNWLLSLVARSLRSVGDADEYLAKSWRSQSGDAALLLELGQIQLDLERYSRAQELFYRALLADRTSIDAIRGMGRAYLGYDRARGRRDLARIADNYGDDSRSMAPKAEVYRWLGVLHDVRKGSEKGYSYLEKAVGMIGETPPLLVEEARYEEARGDTRAARRGFARALERNSSYASAHLGLARTALDSGDMAIARTHLTRFLDLRSTGEDAEWARQKLDELDSAEGSQTQE